MTTQSLSTPRTPTTGMARVVAASSTGMALEAYDFLLYGSAAALVFNEVFFPDQDPLVGTMLAFLSYALGFFARPLGGVIFGHFGDRVGRKPLLIISLVMMGGATFAIGLLPTYSMIGIWAAVLLALLRIVQGVALGGEWGGAMLLVAERVPAHTRGRWTSLPEAGIPLGNLMATGVLAVLAATLTDDAFTSWGWRIPFLLSAVLLVAGYWIRSRVEDTPLFQDLAQDSRTHEQPAAAAHREAATSPARRAVSGDQKSPATDDGLVDSPLRTVVKHHKPQLLICAAARLSENVSYYVVTAFVLVYATEQNGVDKGVVLNALVIGNILQLLATPGFGLLSDKVGRRPVLLAGAAGTACWIWIFFALVDAGGGARIAIAILGGLLFHSALYGPQAAFFSEQFPTAVRYTGMSLAAQVTTVVGGAVAPLIATALLAKFDSWVPVGIYVVCVATVTLVGVALSRETNGRDLAEV
ncbi:MHS family MFS transporter [Nocardioides KLBMP 9356]|uniref:MHS family MFS transporter n=1 Tax=Nocardioides potassii TaxID=2911371 RepID=A0ABS9HA95_9ACTN|nr:MFS transporter [Nocardioides potassii]MCF6378135.1 MHS family MFS transporter [Nocardioides potassii]